MRKDSGLRVINEKLGYIILKRNKWEHYAVERGKRKSCAF